MRSWGGLLALGVITACTIGSGSGTDDGRGTKPAGAMCADSKECANGPCRSEGFCGVNGCGGSKACPAGWTCESSSSVFSGGIFGGTSTFCQPSCAACPSGTTCAEGGTCSRAAATVTVNGSPARTKQPVSLDLVIGAGARSAYEVTWSFSDDGVTPASGTGTHLAVTFAKAGTYALRVLLKGGGLKDESIDAAVIACGEDGDACHEGGACCGGECALDRGAERYCVLTCPASCRPGYSCHGFESYAGSGFPRGEFCLPDPPSITIDVSPAAPKANQPVTLTGHAVSPAGLSLLAQRWYVDDSPLEAATGPTLTLNPTKSEFHRVTFQVFDDSQQIAKKTIEVDIAP